MAPKGLLFININLREKMQQSIEQLSINTLRFLAVDAVQKANSGHPGAPMGLASPAYALWQNHLKHNPADPAWVDRDRFVLSAGHASMLLYGLLHLTGYDLSLDEIRNFRQLGSKTPGHPEHGEAPGVEMTTGPLGQGFAHGVGMAIAERWLAAQYNRPGFDIVDHHIFAIVSDGDLQEGVAAEAASLAGTLGLGKLVYLYDDNKIQIEGPTDLAFTEDVAGRFTAYHWQVLGPVDGADQAAVDQAIARAKEETGQPTIIICRTHIGHGSPRQDSAKAHGEPLGEDNIIATKEKLGWPLEPAFYVPDAVRQQMDARARGAERQEKWRQLFARYQNEYPEEAARFQEQMAGELPEGWDHGLDTLFAGQTKKVATRAASGTVLNHIAQRLPNLIGGSADLGPSTKTLLAGRDDLDSVNPGGGNIHFGVREHAMGAICGGMALHGGVVPYSATFLSFADYMRPPMRLAALMHTRVINVFTHDSIGLGEDGPTHQPVEHLMGLRTMPNMTVIRPADGWETVEAWRAALLNSSGPTALVFSRQGLPLLDQDAMGKAIGLHKGAYILWQSREETPDLILIGTGSETHIALEAGHALAAAGRVIRVVSMPSWELFDAQTREYRESVLPDRVRARVAVEAGTVMGWERYVGLDGAVVGMKGYGASAPSDVLYKHFNITVEGVVEAALALLEKKG